MAGGLGNDVPADGATMDEIVMRGNNVMKGYFEDEEATAEAFRGGWFYSGDLGVVHPGGYMQLLDRAKDVVISGGENISTVEIEQALLTHQAVLEAAVIGVPDEKWGSGPRPLSCSRPARRPARRRSSTTSSPRLPATRRPKLSPSWTSCQRPRRARSRSSSSGSASGPGKTPNLRTNSGLIGVAGGLELLEHAQVAPRTGDLRPRRGDPRDRDAER
jgi:AMP-binding enzyme/AMP-binding enzyme C-terminal domain